MYVCYSILELENIHINNIYFNKQYFKYRNKIPKGLSYQINYEITSNIILNGVITYINNFETYTYLALLEKSILYKYANQILSIHDKNNIFTPKYNCNISLWYTLKYNIQKYSLIGIKIFGIWEAYNEYGIYMKPLLLHPIV